MAQIRSSKKEKRVFLVPILDHADRKPYSYPQLTSASEDTSVQYAGEMIGPKPDQNATHIGPNPNRSTSALIGDLVGGWPSEHRDRFLDRSLELRRSGMTVDQADSRTYREMMAEGDQASKAPELQDFVDWLKSRLESTPFLSVGKSIEEAVDLRFLVTGSDGQPEARLLFKVARYLGYRTGERPASKLRASSGGKVWLKTAEEVATP